MLVRLDWWFPSLVVPPGAKRKQAEAASFGTPGGCAAAAASWGSGREGDAGGRLTVRAVAGSVLLASRWTPVRVSSPRSAWGRHAH